MQIKSNIKLWAEDDRPREKLLSKGAAALSNAELLAILISSGTKEKSAVDLSREILQIAANNLDQLGKLGIKELQKVKGIGEAKAITINAALELGKRRQMGAALERPSINDSREAAEFLIPLMQDTAQETFCVLFLNNAHSLIRHEIISTGGLTGTVADIRMILRSALLHQCSKIIVAHNHPSGNRHPSEADRKLTQQLKDAARLMDILLLDHIIIAGQQYTSFADEHIL